MSNTSPLAAHIAALNAKTLAWVAESPETRWACTVCDDLAHWAQDGVTTPAEFDHYMLVCEAFEANRSAFGYKPSWLGLMSTPDEELRKDIARANEYAVEAAKHDALFEAWDNERQAQALWENPCGELAFVEGCWK